MVQSKVADEVIKFLAKYPIKHPEWDNVLILLQSIRDDKKYRFMEENQTIRCTKNYTQDSTKVYTLINKASITGQK